ncbi:hypothetical protein SAMN05421538_101450 [Paracoccus isoporae]|uniref:Aspartate/glutamate racemase n=1 Tax=Paracoccus isoporae TaxID=591205 RepID=A0A1G6U3Y1_9RHOB|nr:hypothetical protein [Paracoccus isoporae]SDD35904.1 hypothetical protein SAMN05421538_101450 [Paracoccus isoporae]
MSGFIGVLALDTAFPRIPGDAGHPDSYHLPARIRLVEGAGSPEIVRDSPPDPGLVQRFAEAARGLEAEGAVLITSTCGFLISVQQVIARRVSVPVLLSGLSLAPLMLSLAPHRPVGVLTAAADRLGPATLRAAGLAADRLRVAGLENVPLFSETFLVPKHAQRRSFSRDAMERAVVQAGRSLLAQTPEISAVVLECGNLPPYAPALRRALNRPVVSVLDGARLLTG